MQWDSRSTLDDFHMQIGVGSVREHSSSSISRCKTSLETPEKYAGFYEWYLHELWIYSSQSWSKELMGLMPGLSKGITRTDIFNDHIFPTPLSDSNTSKWYPFTVVRSLWLHASEKRSCSSLVGGMKDIVLGKLKPTLTHPANAHKSDSRTWIMRKRRNRLYFLR